MLNELEGEVLAIRFREDKTSINKINGLCVEKIPILDILRKIYFEFELACSDIW